MPETCAFPLCQRIAQRNGLCIGHRIYEDSFPAAIIKEEIKRIKPASDKRKALNRELNKIVADLIKGNPECVIKSPVCTRFSTTANHKQKRSPKNLIKIENLEACCADCNSYVENFPEWAVENGHQVSRFKK